MSRHSDPGEGLNTTSSDDSQRGGSFGRPAGSSSSRWDGMSNVIVAAPPVEVEYVDDPNEADQHPRQQQHMGAVARRSAGSTTFHAATGASSSSFTTPAYAVHRDDSGVATEPTEAEMDAFMRVDQGPDGGTATEAGSPTAELSDLLNQFNVFRRAFFTLQGRCQQAIDRIKREQTATQQRREESERQIQRLRLNGPRRVRLNVGGVHFEVAETLLKKYPGTFFSVLLEGNFAVDVDDSGALFIDRDPVLFRDILYFLRTGDVPLVPSRPCCYCQGNRLNASGSFAAGGGRGNSNNAITWLHRTTAAAGAAVVVIINHRPPPSRDRAARRPQQRPPRQAAAGRPRASLPPAWAQRPPGSPAAGPRPRSRSSSRSSRTTRPSSSC
jgi:hypothetical protein